MRKTIFILAIVLVCLSVQAQFRTYSNEFLNIGAGARGMAMGGSNSSTVKDGTAGYWNPAGLVFVKDHPQVSFMHAEYFAGIGKYDYGSIALPIQGGKRAIAISLLRFAVDDIPNTLFLVEPDGRINYNNIRTFSSADYAVLLSYAQEIRSTERRKLSFGANAKIIYRNVGSFAKAWGIGADFGIQYHSRRLHLSAVGKDITTTFNAWSFSFTEAEKEKLYLTNNDIPVKSTELTAPRLILGAAYDIKLGKSALLTAEANFDLTFDGRRNTVIASNTVSADPRIGLEFSYKNNFFLRAGVYNFQQALKDGDTLNQKKVWIYQPSAGAGFRIPQLNLVIDYAFANLANQSNPLYTHVFSVKLDLIKRQKK